jgi:hypothetical protein
MEDREIRAALDRHWAASDANDFEGEHQIYREDAVLEYPQSGERIRGRRKIQSSRAAQPNRKRFTVRRIIGAGDLREGDHDESERIIQQLIAERGERGVSRDLVSVDARGAEAAADSDDVNSPETYVGHKRAENFASAGGAIKDAPQLYAAASQLRLNQWALAGTGRSKESARLFE